MRISIRSLTGAVASAAQKEAASGLLVLFVLVGLQVSPSAAQGRLDLDRPTQAGGMQVVCTGIGSTAREDPRWEDYPLRVEVAGADGQFLGNVEIAFERDGQSLIRVSCGGPWVLARLGPGSYTVTATYEGRSTSSPVNVPGEGQGRLILRFPEAGGAVSPEHTPSPN